MKRTSVYQKNNILRTDDKFSLFYVLRSQIISTTEYQPFQTVTI